MTVLVGIATDQMNPAQRFAWECAVDPDLAREVRLAEAMDDPDMDVQIA